MSKEITLIDADGNPQFTVADTCLLRFDSGANIRVDFNDKWVQVGIVCRAWFGENEWEPSIGGSCSLILNPSSGVGVWLKPLVLTGTSLVDVTIKAVTTQLPAVYLVVDAQEELLPTAIQQIVVKDKPTGIIFQIQLPQTGISSVFQESLHISIEQQALVCEPKAANLWVFKPMMK